MSPNRICNSCGRSRFEWTVRRWRIEVGELLVEPYWCQDCTKAIQDAIIAAIQRPPQTEPTP
jgi:hypothetical protein